MPSILTLGNRTYFPFVSQPIAYEGRTSRNPLAFKFYDPTRLVGSKTMAEHLRFAVCYWHTFTGNGSDPFGAATRQFPWDSNPDPLAAAHDRMDAAFEFMTKLGVNFWCFHDVDIAPEGSSIQTYEANLHSMVQYAHTKQQASGIELLWGTANLFSHPRYMNGAATNPDFGVVARAGVQVKNCLDATVALGGKGYVFWGGREGYLSLLNTKTKEELRHLGQFLRMARDYGRSIGFTGKFYIEPKPCEPTKHQYDYDVQTVLGFLREHDLQDDFQLNVEVNHATLAGHSFAHELQMAADAHALGSIDANRGDYQNGWDTDQFPIDLYELTEAMLIILQAGGFSHGGINFDAKVRRNSTDLEDLFIAHISGMDAFARALEAAHQLLTDSDYLARLNRRYASFANGLGKSFADGKLSLEDLRKFALESPEPPQISGQQEYFEALLNQYI